MVRRRLALFQMQDARGDASGKVPEGSIGEFPGA